MITISLFALLATSLALLVWVAQLLKNIRALEELTNTLHERVAVKEELLVEKTQQIHDLQEKLFETKESSNFLLESYQEDLDVAQECIWDKERQVSELAEANQRVADTLLSLSYKEDPVTSKELTELREIALRWDQIPF